MYSEDQLRELVNQSIMALELNREPSKLYDPISYSLSVGGKRIRPVLSLLSYQLYNELVDNYALIPAIALEVFHGFTLIHDDIMDKAEIRRGMPTVHKKWCENTAILSGDAMCIESYRLISQSNPIYLAEILSVFNKTAAEVCEGQQLDMDFESSPIITEEDYLSMIQLKTAVLIAASAKIGGIAGGASKKDQDILYRFGLSLGFAFQIQDDLLDTYGDSKVFGKAIGGDIATNKKTFLLVTALRNAQASTLASLKNVLASKGKVDEKERYRIVKSIYDELGIQQIASAKVEYFFSEALKELDKIQVSNDRKDCLLAFAHALVNRSK